MTVIGSSTGSITISQSVNQSVQNSMSEISIRYLLITGCENLPIRHIHAHPLSFGIAANGSTVISLIPCPKKIQSTLHPDKEIIYKHKSEIFNNNLL